MTDEENIAIGGLGAHAIYDLMLRAVDAVVQHDDAMAAATLMCLFEEGTRLDALAFTVGCFSVMRQCLPPGQDVKLVVARLYPDGSYELTDMPVVEAFLEDRADLLVSEMFVSYLGGDLEKVVDRWVGADDTIAAQAVGLTLRTAGQLYDVWRSARANLS